MKGFIAFLAVAVMAASAVVLEPKPFKRQIPADRLRGKKERELYSLMSFQQLKF